MLETNQPTTQPTNQPTNQPANSPIPDRCPKQNRRWISAEAGAPREVDRAWLSKTRGCDNQNRGVPAAALAALP
jgi:hypothetical protein